MGKTEQSMSSLSARVVDSANGEITNRHFMFFSFTLRFPFVVGVAFAQV
jgi:hypothetical protein